MANRITGLEDLSESVPGEYQSPRYQQREPGIRWLIAAPVLILLALLVASGVYYVLQKKEEAHEKSRFSEKLGDYEDVASRKMQPFELPDDGDLRRAVELYKRGYLKPAQAVFQEIVESAKPDAVKSFALVYLGIMADDEGKYNLAVDFFNRAIRFDPQNFYAQYNLAIALRHKGLYREALNQLEKARALRPDLIDAGILKGQLQYQSNDLQGAESTLKQITAETGDPMALYNLGMVYKKEGKFAEAKAAFLEALDKAAAGEIAYKAAAQLGLVHASQGDLPNAKYYFERAIELSPQNPKYYYNLALVLYRSGDNESALKQLTKAVQLGNENPQTYSYISQLYLELGKPAQAEAALAKALEQAPQDTVLLSELADLQIAQGKWGPAITALKRILELSTKTKEKATALYNLGRVYAELRDYSSAETALQRAYDLDNLNEDTLVALGQLHADRGEGHKAIALFKEALRVNPDNIKVLRGQGELYLKLGLLTEAEEALKKLTIHPLAKETDMHFAALHLGDIYRRRRLYDEAISYFDRALTSGDTDTRYRAMASSAEAMLMADKPSALILARLQNAIALKPDAEEARLLLARALLREGSVRSQERAEEELTGVIRLEKGTPEWLSKAHTLRGILFYKQGLFHRAIEDFNRALELDPSNNEAFQNKRATAARLENG